MKAVKFIPNIFRDLAKGFSKQKELDNALKRARLTYTAEDWASLSLFSFVVAFLIAFFLTTLFAYLLKQGILSLIIGLVLAAIASTITFAFIYYYPWLVADERKKKIENALPFATLYLATLAHSGMPPQYMFKILAKFKEYGELSKEAAKISSDIETLGLDIIEALVRAIARSPSPAWTELLAGLRTTITIGGDLGKFLEEKANGFVAEYSRKLQEFSSFLSLLIEVYVTLIIIGAIFFIIISSIMSSIGAVPVSLLKAVNVLIVAVGIPIITAMFIIIAKSISPLED